MGKFAEEFDAKRAPTLKALAAMSDVIVTIVPDGKIVRQICFGSDGDDAGDRLAGAFKPGAIVVDMSSSAPTGTRALGDALQKDRKSTRLNSSHSCASRMPSSA